MAIISEATVISKPVRRGIRPSGPLETDRYVTQSTVIRSTTRFQIIRRWSDAQLISWCKWLSLKLKEHIHRNGITPEWRLISSIGRLGQNYHQPQSSPLIPITGPSYPRMAIMVCFPPYLMHLPNQWWWWTSFSCWSRLIAVTKMLFCSFFLLNGFWILPKVNFCLVLFH